MHSFCCVLDFGSLGIFSFVGNRIAVNHYIYSLILSSGSLFLFALWQNIIENLHLDILKGKDNHLSYLCLLLCLLSRTPQSRRWRGKSVTSTWMMRTCVIRCWPAAWLKRSAVVRWEQAGGTTVRSIPAPYQEQVLIYIMHNTQSKKYSTENCKNTFV